MADVDLVNGTPWTNVDLYNGILKANIDYIMGGIIAPAAAAGEPSGTPAMWWDADQITGLSDDDLLSPWLDMSGNDRSLLRTPDAAKPHYRTGVQNGLPIVRFDGSADDMNTTAGFSLAQPTTMFIMLKIINTSGAGFVIGGAGSGTRQQVYHIDADPTFLMHAGTAITTTTDLTGAFEIIVMRFNGASSWIRLNGSQNNIADPGAQALTAPVFVCTSYGGGGNVAGDIGEIIVYDGAEDPSANEAYLAAKWGISL